MTEAMASFCKDEVCAIRILLLPRRSRMLQTISIVMHLQLHRASAKRFLHRSCLDRGLVDKDDTPHLENPRIANALFSALSDFFAPKYPAAV